MSRVPVCTVNHKNRFCYKYVYEPIYLGLHPSIYLHNISQKSTQELMLIFIFQGIFNFMEPEFTKECYFFLIFYIVCEHIICFYCIGC